ncbi:hypothetical protein BS639_01820 [Rouxiella silvae]|uniref:Uncharacterized protein n=1 Tax=Rouxiella silvae TaxID=1646373 RepID=A0ABX3U6D7_9GAMM|nr:hypothetical protein BS639_01820 [Rouxiella silvae]
MRLHCQRQFCDGDPLLPAMTERTKQSRLALLSLRQIFSRFSFIRQAGKVMNKENAMTWHYGIMTQLFWEYLFSE